MLIEVWSDVVCPWCAIGKKNLEAALADFGGEVEVEWRSFELDTTAPREQPLDLADHLARKYRVNRPRALALMDQARQAGLAAGVDLRFDRVRPGNTHDAHRLLHLAAERGRQGALKTRLLAASLTEGEAIGQPEVLQRLAEEVGLDAAEVALVLASDAYAEAVRADKAEALELGARGVPFFLFDGRLAVPGAQPVEVFQRALRQAWPDVGPAPGCDADGCAI
ncbi:MAG: DsbA family oxidoreductase [bacterium]